MAPVRSWEAQVVSLVPALSEGSISSLIFFFFLIFGHMTGHVGS